MIKIVSITVAALGGAAACLIAASTSSAGAVVPCTADHLRPAFEGSQGAAGTIQDTWRLRNMGTAACTVSGFVGPHNYRSDGRPLQTHVTDTGTPGLVSLLPGQHASFRLRYANPAIAGCTGEPAARMTILVPSNTLPVIAGRGEHACQGHLTETPLVHGG